MMGESCDGAGGQLKIEERERRVGKRGRERERERENNVHLSS